jgi:hypothetical protein
MSSPQCGDVVAANVVLTHDLVCSGDGLVVPGFADVTLDLNGHSIIGSGNGTGVAILFDQNEDPSRSTPGAVTVKFGAIQGFDLGVLMQSGPGGGGVSTLLLDRLLIRDNNTGVVGAALSGVDKALSNSVISSNHGDGVRLGPGRFRMINDAVTKNAGNGIAAFRNSLGDLRDSFIAHNGGVGALLDDTVAVISGNTFRGNGSTGLAVQEEICAFFPRYVVSDNVATQNAGGGMSMSASCESPPPPPSGSGNVAKNNQVFDCLVIVCAKNRGQAKK